jgi:hypothetical protein
MPEMTSAYRKIASTSWFSRCLPGMRSELYIGDDHLLLATQIVVFEKYHRFFFSDIEAIIAAKSNRWIWASVVWALCLPLGLLWNLGHAPWCYAIGAVWVVFAGAILIWNLLAGPTYVVKIQTVAQTRRLKAIERARRYEAFQRVVIPLVMAGQQPNAVPAQARPDHGL